jgi:hypothetical protein
MNKKKLKSYRELFVILYFMRKECSSMHFEDKFSYIFFLNFTTGGKD